MTDIPDPGHNISPLNAELFREFFGRYGSFLQLWQTYEIVIEVAIMRQLGLSIRQASIVLNSLNFAAKSSILLALLKEDGERNKGAVSAITEAQTQAERNDFTHSFLAFRGDGSMSLIRRNVRNGNYSVKPRDVSAISMHDHAFAFGENLRLAMEALEVTSEDIDRYSTEIESHA
jgi:hypothetical protein